MYFDKTFCLNFERFLVFARIFLNVCINLSSFSWGQGAVKKGHFDDINIERILGWEAVLVNITIFIKSAKIEISGAYLKSYKI